MAEKFMEYLSKASQLLHRADHMLYMTYPLVKDKRLLLKIIEYLGESMVSMINSILQYDYLYKRIELYKNARENFETFRQSCAPRYGITSEEINKITELLRIMQRHRESQMEFMKKDQLVIMSNNSARTEVITVEKIKEFLIIAKNVLGKVERELKKQPHH